MTSYGYPSAFNLSNHVQSQSIQARLPNTGLLEPVNNTPSLSSTRNGGATTNDSNARTANLVWVLSKHRTLCSFKSCTTCNEGTLDRSSSKNAKSVSKSGFGDCVRVALSPRYAMDGKTRRGRINEEKRSEVIVRRRKRGQARARSCR